MQSLARQKNSVADTSRKASYANRIEFFPGYLGIESTDSINTNSLRYRFLKQLLPNMKDSTFYVVEANSTGAKIIIRNFVFYKDNVGNTEVQLYNYYDKTWHKRGKIKLQAFNLDHDLKKYILKNGKGFNYEDIIITRIERDKFSSISSEYFVDGTLSIDSGIKQVLDDDIKGKFVN
jgi:hypothetical protein